MVQSILFFSLGFLVAGFLALMIAPAIWRRAVALTRRRIEASVPLSLADIQADKDRIRAEFAMSTRRLEMSIKSLKEKAAALKIEIGRNREELNRLAVERDEKHQAFSALEAQAGELRAELRQREEQLRLLGDRLVEAEQALQERALDLDEASLMASNRQIELVARQAERPVGDVEQRKGIDQRMQDIAAENKTVRDSLKAERKKIAELEKQLEGVVAALADREEKLDRREREFAHLREQVMNKSEAEDELSEKLIDAQKEKVELEAELAEMGARMSVLLSGAKDGDAEKAMAKLSEERERLQARLTTLTRENRRLKAELSAHAKAKAEDWDERQSNALLRKQINDLAAEVVSLTAALEGPDSPINKVLASAPADAAATEKIVSLADRVRALQEAAQKG
ncbi:hypothetical protein SAZ10_10720 [Mesorhizobium sp. BAC0120]|uniref:hypothetical protein n=1 Tax=Mesorhizobium sp. BAC0120 TaxID=3090670 RepID=UPI00298CC88F|nr:hypothetical protein [Mesorhizobium sp. BAC0120]MDW6022225.1 hypothetical protein [Mesorhizobium sp. BAC0120]